MGEYPSTSIIRNINSTHYLPHDDAIRSLSHEYLIIHEILEDAVELGTLLFRDDVEIVLDLDVVQLAGAFLALALDVLLHDGAVHLDLKYDAIQQSIIKKNIKANIIHIIGADPHAVKISNNKEMMQKRVPNTDPGLVESGVYVDPREKFFDRPKVVTFDYFKGKC